MGFREGTNLTFEAPTETTSKRVHPQERSKQEVTFARWSGLLVVLCGPKTGASSVPNAVWELAVVQS
eukprot:1785446-Amphidinium_carterae.1